MVELMPVNDSSTHAAPKQPWTRTFRTSSPLARSSFVLGVVGVVFLVVPTLVLILLGYLKRELGMLVIIVLMNLVFAVLLIAALTGIVLAGLSLRKEKNLYSLVGPVSYTHLTLPTKRIV